MIDPNELTTWMEKASLIWRTFPDYNEVETKIDFATWYIEISDEVKEMFHDYIDQFLYP